MGTEGANVRFEVARVRRSMEFWPPEREGLFGEARYTYRFPVAQRTVPA